MTTDTPRDPDRPESDRPALDAHKLLREAVAGGAASSSPAGRFEPPPVADLQPRFPELDLIERIGRGGMGAVYRAVQRKLGRTVALKVLPPELQQDPSFEERFLREARALAALQHPRILTVHDFGERDGLYYLVTEFVDGMNLRQLMDMGELSPAEALRITPQICEALQFAHDRGIVHRDIKPENVLVDRDGDVRIADFGLARVLGEPDGSPTLTRSTQVLGTPHYMAPEQWREGRTIDHRADIYAVGVVLYEMLTGQLPLGHFEPPSRRRGVPRGLDQVVQKSLAQQPENRYQQAREVSHDLRREGARVGSAAKRDVRGVGEGRGRLPAALKVGWALALLVLLGLVALRIATMRANDRYFELEYQREEMLAEAQVWRRQNALEYMSEDALLRDYYEDVVLPAWRRETALAAAGVAIPAPEFPEPGPHMPGIAMSFLLLPLFGGLALVLPICGFRAIATLRRRGAGARGAGLAVFTAWIVPVVVAATVPGVILDANMHDGDTAMLGAVIIAVVVSALGIAWMVFQTRTLRREQTTT